ncbi:hypothetical protein F2P56_013365 [Juglans regia]|uniref:Protein REVEILLE 7-like isoform X1 n=2 Tax=Juglans regia TaxID=51240 RepID=A0A2I4GYY0_JUGRE|nr:protein REVEILLE 7-like isoform X1 [Juglans regia]KAF5469281.1 hypothetical protein F2P56_013365 [Juglans regia]
MAVQQQNVTSNLSVTSCNYRSDGAARSEMVVQKEETGSFGNYNALKVRKPYTIVKQREKWTEEEHQKFIEALRLYGRGWRQIEAHVGSKTAVQIRSHAQKFFSKVVRASSSSIENSIEPVEIPPPRPKKKPSHPYPRKSLDSPNGISLTNQTERSPLPNLLVAKKGTKSPTSVLSAAGSDSLESAASEQQIACSSPTSCATDMQSISFSPVEKEKAHMTSNSTVQEEKGSFSSTPEGFSSMKFDFASKGTLSTKGDEATGEPVTSIKLFGRTVVVTDSRKPCYPGTGNTESLISNIRVENSAVDKGDFVKRLPSDQLDVHLSLEIDNCKSMLLPCQAPVKSVEHLKENINSVEANPCVSLPWWSLYQGQPFCYFPSYNQTSVQVPTGSYVEVDTMEGEVMKERSCTSSNSASVSEVENGEKNSDAIDSESQKPLRKGRISPCNSMRGFVPYKRCLAERDTNSSMVDMDEREGQRARVCS